MKEVTCCFTGNRPQKLPWGFDENDPRCEALKKVLKDTILSAISQGYTHFISGFANGVDMMAAEILIALKNQQPDLGIFLEGAIPCPSQSNSWNEQSKDRYQTLKSQADKITEVSPLYTPYCMAKRNQYMVDSSSLLIAVWGGQSGGTQSTIKYAEKKGARIITIVP